MKVRSDSRALAFNALTERLPSLTSGQVGILIDMAAMLLEDGEREAAADLLFVAMPGDGTEVGRVLTLLAGIR